MTVIETLLTTVGSCITGGFLTLLIPRVSMTKNEQYTALIMLVEQLQKNVNENNMEIIELKKEVAIWRGKYYTELEEKTRLAGDVRQLTAALKKFNIDHNS